MSGGAAEEGEKMIIRVNGGAMEVREGTMVAAALMNAGVSTRRSVNGEARGPVCGMGICMECRARVNGVAHVRSCQMVCEPDMEIETE